MSADVQIPVVCSCPACACLECGAGYVDRPLALDLAVPVSELHDCKTLASLTMVPYAPFMPGAAWTECHARDLDFIPRCAADTCNQPVQLIGITMIPSQRTRRSTIYALHLPLVPNQHSNFAALSSLVDRAAQI